MRTDGVNPPVFFYAQAPHMEVCASCVTSRRNSFSYSIMVNYVPVPIKSLRIHHMPVQAA